MAADSGSSGITMDVAAANSIVGRMESLWRDRHLSGDIEQILALYTPDALFFGSLPRMFIGIEGIREYLGGVPLSAARDVRFFNRHLRVLGNEAIASAAYVHFDLELESRPVRWRFGMSWTLIRCRDDWKIASHHASPRDEK